MTPLLSQSEIDACTCDAATRPWVRMPTDLLAVRQGCRFDVDAAERVRRFFRTKLRHTTGGQFVGKPFELLPWQWEWVVAPLFGWKRADGLRRFRTFYVSTPKKNGKTALFSGLSIYLTGFDGEPSAQVYSAASDRAQASIIYAEAAKMVRATPWLSQRFDLVNTRKRMTHDSGSFYQALSADARRNEGWNASAVLFDELHAQPDRSLWDTLRYAGRARQQPLIGALTTAGQDLETICGEQYTYAKKIMAGEVDDITFLPAVWEAEDDDEWDDERTWAKANPSLGVTIQIADLRSDHAEAAAVPGKEAMFRWYTLNQWRKADHAWLPMETWDRCELQVDIDRLAGRECFAGLDLSATDDTTSLCLVFPQDESMLVWWRSYLPELNIDRLAKKHRVPYRAWQKQGLLVGTPGNVVDYRHIRSDLLRLNERNRIVKLSVDRKFQGQQLESDLIADGFDVEPMGAGWVSQDLPLKEIERLVLARRLGHGGNPMARWHASNAVVTIDKNGNYSLTKKMSRSKIDMITALAGAMFCAMRPRKPKPTNYYETHQFQMI
jgi:phage terminase large subunit-like protein